MQPLISSGLAYKLRSGALWRRRHSGVQNDANAARTAPAQSHEPHAGHEGTYHPAPLTTPYRSSIHHTLRSTLHIHISISTPTIIFYIIFPTFEYGSFFDISASIT